MTRSILVLGVWMVVSGIACAESDPVVSKNASALIAEINKKGASQVIQGLWGKPDWYNVTGKIASGEPAWIDVAVALRAGSDAGSTSELRSAMFLALSKNPDYVLRVLETAEKPPHHVFLLSDVCEGRVDPPSTYQEALAELVHTRAAVEKVQAKELQSKRDICLTKLREGEGHLKRFFGVAGQ